MKKPKHIAPQYEFPVVGQIFNLYGGEAAHTRENLPERMPDQRAGSVPSDRWELIEGTEDNEAFREFRNTRTGKTKFQFEMP